VIGVAADAAVIDSSLGAVAVHTRLDRGQVEITGEFTGHHMVAIQAAQAFLVHVVVEFSKRHPAVGSDHFFDLGSRIVTLGFHHIMAGRAACEWGAASTRDDSFHVRVKNGALQVLTGFITLFNGYLFLLHIEGEFIRAGDTLMAFGILLVLYVKASQEGTNIVRITMRQVDTGFVIFCGSVGIELEGMAFYTVLPVGDRLLVFTLGIALMAVAAIEGSGDLITGLQVNCVIELERALIANSVTDLLELGVIGIKRGDDFSVALIRTFSWLNFRMGVEGGKCVGVGLHSDFSRGGHEFGGTVA